MVQKTALELSSPESPIFHMEFNLIITSVTLKNGPLASTDYDLICAPPPTEHLVLKPG